MNFFNSKYVKIFPCYSRGYSDSTEGTTQSNPIENSATQVIDPEARLLTEANFTNLYGNVLGRRSYIVECLKGDNPKTKVVIQGYYFEISDPTFTFTENVTLIIRLAPRVIALESEADCTRSTYTLASLQEGEGSQWLDCPTGETDSANKPIYRCTAIGYYEGESIPDDYTEAKGYYKLSYNTALKLDAEGFDALAVFTDKDKKAIESLAGLFQEDDSTFISVKKYIDDAIKQAKDNVVGTETDTSDTQTIYGVKAAITEAQASAATAAQKAQEAAITTIMGNEDPDDATTPTLTGVRKAFRDADAELDERIQQIEKFFNDEGYTSEGIAKTIDTLADFQEYIDTHDLAAQSLLAHAGEEGKELHLKDNERKRWDDAYDSAVGLEATVNGKAESTEGAGDAVVGLVTKVADNAKAIEENATAIEDITKAETGAIAIAVAAEAKDRDDAIETAFTTIVGTIAEGTTVVTMIGAKANTATTLNGYGIGDAYTKTEVNEAIDNAKKSILGDGVKEAYNTLKEIQDILEGTNGETIDGLIEAVADNKAKIETLNGDVNTTGSVDQKIADVIGTKDDTSDSDTLLGLRQRIDEKVASVDKKAGTAITVDNTDSKNPKIGLALNNPGNNVILSQTGAGLSAAIDLGAYKTDTENEGKYKQLQEAITAATTDANVFVYGADQNENGEITVKTKAVDFSNYYTMDETDGKVHDHVNGTGTVVGGSAAGGDVAINLNLEFAELGEDKKLKLVDKTSKAVVAEFEATDFIKDGMLDEVSYNADTNELTFTWNTDAGKTIDVVALSDILDPYVFEAGALLNVATDGTTVTYSHETVDVPTESGGTGRKYLTGVTTDGYGHITGFTTASETDQDLGNYKTKQHDYEKTGDTKQTITKVTQSDNGVIEVTYGDIDFGDHNHIASEITDFSSAVADIEVNSAKKVACALTIKTTETEDVSFDGSEACAIDISLVAQVASEINKLTSDENVEGSIAYLIKDAISKIVPENIYAVAFEANGGTGYMQPQVVIGESYKLPECSFEPCDRFKGWGTSVDAETPLTAGTEYILTANTIFYALWEIENPSEPAVPDIPENDPTEPIE